MYALFAVALLLLIVWVIGMITHFVVSAAIHLLLAAAVILFIIGLVIGRRTAVR
jgi:hypothetical protein